MPFLFALLFIFFIASNVQSMEKGKQRERTQLAEEYCARTEELKAAYDNCVAKIQLKGFKE